MQFNIPNTKQEMYNILNDIFYHYRIKRESYDGVNLKQLELDRMSYSSPSDSELETTAKAMVAPDQQREKDKRRSEISNNISKLNSQLKAAKESAQSINETVEALYEKSLEKVNQQARKNGLINSGILFDKIYQLEVEKNAKILELNTARNKEIAAINAELSAQNELLEECETYFAVAHEKDVSKKFLELSKERDEKENEVFKYNNGIEEKEQRYANTLLQASANLEIKFLQISAGEFTKDQLTTMGYYEDVIRCVCGYYNQLSALAAFQDVSTDQKLPIYLDHYYENILYMYQSRTGI